MLQFGELQGHPAEVQKFRGISKNVVSTSDSPSDAGEKPYQRGVSA